MFIFVFVLVLFSVVVHGLLASQARWIINNTFIIHINMRFFIPCLLFLLSVLSSLSPLSALQCGQSYTIQNEGLKNYCYYDTLNVPTIGVGFNLRRSDAADALAAYGLDLDAVLADCQRGTKTQMLTNEDAVDLFSEYSYPPAVECAEQYAGEQPPYVTAALADLAFNLGCRGLNNFRTMRAALLLGEYADAAAAAKNSRWCGQVKTRCAKDVACLASGQ